MYSLSSVFVPKIVTNELRSYTKIHELFISRGITRLFHHLISFVLTFIFSHIFTCKPMYFGLLLLMMLFFSFMPRGKKTRRNKRASSAPPCFESPRKQMKWRNESMLNALEAVKKGSSIKRAAEEYGVPRTTLQD